MILLGRPLSPYVRRVLVTLNYYGLPFEHREIQHTGDDAPALRKINPIGRVPALVLDDEQVIVESSAILDYLDREVSADRSLTPLVGKDRTRVMSLLGITTGSIDKAITVSYEARFRPQEKRHEPWVERCQEQVRGGYQWLESQLDGDWFVNGKLSQVDVTAAVGWQYMGIGLKDLRDTIQAPRIDALATRLMEHGWFSSSLPKA